MIQFNNTNKNICYFNKEDIVNGYLIVKYIDENIEYKTILSIENINDSNYKYITIKQTNNNESTHSLKLTNQLTSNQKQITITFESNKNKIDLSQFNDIILQNDTWCILLDTYNSLENTNTEETLKIISFDNSNIVNNKIIFSLNQLGLTETTNITILDNNNEQQENSNKIKYYWLNNSFIIEFLSQNTNNQYIEGIWRLKYYVTNIEQNTTDLIYYPGTYVKLNQLQSERANRIIDEYLNPSIIQYRQITIHHEVATRIYQNQFKLSYQNWNDGQIYVFLNNYPVRLNSDMYTVDKQHGKIFMNFKCIQGDNIMCTYNFNYFPSHILYGFIQRAVSQLNTGPIGTMSQYTFENCPIYWDGLIADYVYTYCLDRLILDYDIWKGRLIFAIGPQGLADGSDNIISQLESQRSAAWERINLTINNPKFKAKQTLAYPTRYYIDGISPFGRYPGLSGHGVAGGRFRGLVINRYGGSF